MMFIGKTLEGVSGANDHNGDRVMGVQMNKFNKLFGGLIGSTALLASLVACAPGAERVGSGGEVDSLGAGIIGGTEVPETSPLAKVVVALYNRAGGGLCTGTLLGNNFVLTAAHCVPKDPTQLVVIFNTKLVAEQGRVLPVDGGMVSPIWGTVRGKDVGDIALLHYKGTTPPDYKYIGILPANRQNILRNGNLMLLAGYGASDGVAQTGAGILRQVSARVGDAAFGRTEILITQEDGKGSCNGDSGGPAFTAIGGTFYVWGVTSRGDEHCKIGGVYTNAAQYHTWLAQAGQQILQTIAARERGLPVPAVRR